MSDSTCNECGTGPRGVEGHPDLSLHVSPPGEGGTRKASFKCGACGLEWLRTYMGSGVFVWNRAG